MKQITDYEMILVKIIHDRWKREIEEAIDRVKYGKEFCAERHRLNPGGIRCGIKARSSLRLVSGLSFRMIMVLSDILTHGFSLRRFVFFPDKSPYMVV